MHEQWECLMPYYNIDGGLTDVQRTALEAHLQSCDSCRETLRQWQDIHHAMRIRAQRQASSLPPLKLPVSLPHTNGHMEQKRMSMYFPISRATIEDRRASHASPLPVRIRVFQAMSFAAVVAAMALFAVLTWIVNDNLRPIPATVTLQDRFDGTIYDYLVSDARFSRTVEIIDRDVWLYNVLTSDDPVTFFAMPDDVIVPILEALESSEQEGFSLEERIRAVLFNHIVNGEWTAAQLAAVNELTGEFQEGDYSYRNSIRITQNAAGNMVLNRQARLTEIDIRTANGMVHVVNDTLVPDDLITPPEPLFISVYDIIRREHDLTVFRAAIDQTTWAKSILQNSATVTIFVVNNEEMRAIMDGQDVEDFEWESFMFSHMLDGLWSLDLLLQAGVIHNNWEMGSSTYGSRLTVDQSESTSFGTTFHSFRVNDHVSIINPNAQIVSNGIIHIIDMPLSRLEPRE